MKTFHQFGVYGEAVITLITVQNTLRVGRVECLAPDLVLEQLHAVLEDIPPAAAKTGALGNSELVRAIAGAAAEFDFPLVVDPVMISKHGQALLAPAARQILERELVPRARLLMPNLPEAAALAEIEIRSRDDRKRAARRLRAMGAAAVLIKGGHAEHDADDLLLDGDRWYEYPAARLATRHTHGTGCTYSAAITACLARGDELPDAVATAKAFITEAIATAPGLGHGIGPVNHHAFPGNTGRTKSGPA